MFRSHFGWTQSLTFRILAFNLLGLLLTFLGFFFFLNRFQTKTLRDGMDADLEREVLMVTAEMEEWDRPLTLAEWKNELTRYSRAAGIKRSCFRFIDQKGWTAYSDLEYWPGLLEHPIPYEALRQHPFIWETADLKPGPARIIYFRFPEGHVLQIGRDLEAVQTALDYSRKMITAGILVATVVCALLMGFFTYRGLRGIFQVSEAAIRIREQGTLGYRVPDRTGSRETDLLAQGFNQMMERIQLLMENLRTVLDNIAHDLRTPVTRMRGIAEAELRKDQTDSELAGHVIEECDILLNLTNTLLEITAAESGLYPWHFQSLDLAELVRDGCDLFMPVLEDKNLSFQSELPQQLVVTSDGRVLQRVVANLLDNAIKYSDEGGTISVTLRDQGEWAQLSVADQGIGINAAEIPLIFNRFYRSDRSRTRQGSGLGLAFCKAALEGLGGEIQVLSELEHGTTFQVRIRKQGSEPPQT